jgi:uncharacterized repeat protein (TIGR01451 family)
MKRTTLKAARVLLLLGFAAGPFAADTALAQGPTPEGTVITNTAVVNWTDANGNTYAPDSASVSVTVGFAAGIDVIAGAATVTPAPGSTGNTLTFAIDNIGNGTDSVSVGESISVGGIITVTGYQIDGAGPIYATLADLNLALAGTPITTGAGNGISVVVIYDVAAGVGGQSTVYTLTATSLRDATVSNSDMTTINPTEALAVAVTPDGGQNLQHLPSNGSNYTFTFTVQNNGNGPEDFDLRSYPQDATDVSIVSVNGVAGDSTRITLAAGASTTIDVVYSVLDVPAGTPDTVFLRARSVTGPGTAQDQGFADLTVIRPSVTIAKAAYMDDKSGPLTGDPVPGDFFQYRIEVTNTGSAPASSVVVTDDLPAEVTFDSTTDDGNWSSITFADPTVTATLNGSLAPGNSAVFWIRVQVK